MAVNAKLSWNKEKVMLAAQKGLDIEGIAFQVEAHAKQNIVDNDQVDTGFLLNSVYVIFPDRDTFGETLSPGEYANRAGQLVKRDIAPPPPLPKSVKAAVAAGADYAIYQEIAMPFLELALYQTANDIEQFVKPF